MKSRIEHGVYCQSYIFTFPSSFSSSHAELKDLVLKTVTVSNMSGHLLVTYGSLAILQDCIIHGDSNFAHYHKIQCDITTSHATAYV